MSIQITKRNGKLQALSFDKVLYRLRQLKNQAPTLDHVNADAIAQQVISGIYDKVSSSDLDELAARLAISMSLDHPEYSQLASRILVSNMHKNTNDHFSKAVDILSKSGLVSDKLATHVAAMAETLDRAIDHARDYRFDYFGFKTLEKSYLLKTYDPKTQSYKIIERPQYMYMRVAVCLHETNIAKVLETYECLSKGLFTHATPTLFNAGTNVQQLSSCFLIDFQDSIEGIFQGTISDCAMISKYAGGIGCWVHDIRADGSLIKSTNGRSTGLIPLLRVVNNVAEYINQGGKRAGSIAVYLSPWHADIMDFLDLRKNQGDHKRRARDLFYALWIPDAFMRAVKDNGPWFLMSPDECQGLSDAYGDAFDALYYGYVRDKKYRKEIKAQELWRKIVELQIESGMPYLLYADAANKKSNQQNIGTIKSSNLCSEIILYSDAEETAVCNLASVSLPAFIKKNGEYDFELLHKTVKIVTRNLDRVIDVNFYPTEKTRRSNLRHRPIGIGVQGLADLYIRMGYPFESDPARQLNIDVHETIYHAALEASMELAKEHGSYSTFAGSPASKGLLQPDLWGVPYSNRYDFDKLKQDIMTFGLRHSEVTALMPTASTSQILGNTEAFEPITSNVYVRSTSAGEFPMINKYLVNDLEKLSLWNKKTREQLLLNDGSIQNMDVPQHLKNLYKTAWEIKQRELIDQSAARGPFVSQSQSLNLFVQNPSVAVLTAMHFYAWEKKLKTGQYYLRSQASTTAAKVTVTPQQQQQQQQQLDKEQCSLLNREACEVCSS